MPQMCETRAGEARASRNSLAGTFHGLHTSPAFAPQAIPKLIALHIGEQFFRRFALGGEHD